MTLRGQGAPARSQHRLPVPTCLPRLFPSRGPPPGGPHCSPHPPSNPVPSRVPVANQKAAVPRVGGGADWRSLKSPLQRAWSTRSPTPGGDRARLSLLPHAPQLCSSAILHHVGQPGPSQRPDEAVEGAAGLAGTLCSPEPHEKVGGGE